MNATNEAKILELRGITGLPVMDCRVALFQAKGNFDKAFQGVQELVRKTTAYREDAGGSSQRS